MIRSTPLSAYQNPTNPRRRAAAAAAAHLREGVTAASATRGLAIMAPTPLITPALMAAMARSCFWALRW
jgi:hypothetical protein